MSIHLDYANGDLDFATWLTLVDASTSVRLGVSLFDLDEDYPLREAYDNGESPIEIAIEIALEQGWEA